MKAFVIKPEAQEIVEVNYDGDISTIYQWIDATMFDAARFNPEGDAAYVDDEGLLVGKPLFTIEGYPQPLAGRAMIIGCDMETGESRDAQVTLEWLKKNVRYVEAMRINGKVRLIDVTEQDY